MAESPEELRTWELSVIDEQVPLVSVDNSVAPLEASPMVELAQSLPPNPVLTSGTDSPMVPAGVYPPSIPSPSTVDSTHPISPYHHLNHNPLLAAAASTSLPARMCTVSHCHKILPGYYRYKRCEQHRLQNRHHSQLKRVREKEVKAVGPEDGAILVEIPPEMETSEGADKHKHDREPLGTKQATVSLATGAIEGAKEAVISPSMTGGAAHKDLDDSESKKDKSPDPVRWFTLKLFKQSFSLRLPRNVQSSLVLLAIVIIFFFLLSGGDRATHVDL